MTALGLPARDVPSHSASSPVPPPTPPYLGPARWLLAFGVCLALLLPAPAENPQSSDVVLTKDAPESLADLRFLESRVKDVVERVVPCTVAIRVGATIGSGVIISADGYVLTAGHVAGGFGRNVTLTFPDGRQVKGKTLGWDGHRDSGLIQITDEGPWPFVEMGNSREIRNGEWCVAIGHPGGYRRGRPPVPRLGRVVSQRRGLIRTDCPLVGGDSGGPLVDLKGRVIGIHSRIRADITYNFHVPVDTYRGSWTQLQEGVPVLGVYADTTRQGCEVTGVAPGFPADKIGLRELDVITRVNGKHIRSQDDLLDVITAQKVGDEVSLTVRRADEILSYKVVLARQP